MNSRFGAAAQYGSGAVAGSAFSTVEMGRFVGGYANPAIYEN
jgi:hypothetical protein